MADTRRKWNSWAEFVNHCTVEGPSLARGSRTSGKRFTGTDTFDEALALARRGWLEPVADIEAQAQALSDSLADSLHTAFAVEHSRAGFVVDVGRYLSGQPDCMFQSVPIETAKPGRIVTILLNVAASGSVSQAAFRSRGAAIVALVSLIESTGNRCEVWVECSSRKRTKSATHTWSGVACVKQAGEQLDLPVVAFALAHPACLRRLFYSAADGESATIRRQNGTSNGQWSAQPVDAIQVAEVGASVAFIEGMRSADSTRDWEPWILEQLTELGLAG